jgi:hypothetical protein
MPTARSRRKRAMLLQLLTVKIPHPLLLIPIRMLTRC